VAPVSAQPDDERPSGRAATLLLAALFVFLAIRFVASLPGTYAVQLNDFPAYYGAGQLVAYGEIERLYTAEFKWFTNLPAVALLFSPLAKLSYAEAWRLFWWLQLSSFVATLGLLTWSVRRHFPPLDLTRFAAVGVIALAFAPVVRRCLALGQTTPMMVLAFALVYLLMRAGRPRSAGALLGLICMIKIPPILLIPLLGLRRRFDVAVPALLVLVAGVAISWGAFGTELMQQYADRVIWDNFGRSEAAFNNQSLDGALMRLFSDRGLADWTTIPRPTSVTLGVLAVALTLGALLMLRAPHFLWPARPPSNGDPQRGSLELELALGVSLMLLLFPVVWIHYYLFLLVPLCLLPFWWQARGVSAPPVAVALVILGGLLASGFESHANSFYQARESDLLFRMRQNLQPLGATLLVVGLSWPLAEIARRNARDN